MKSFGIAVAFFVFNRPDTTRKVFEAISKARPTKLLLIADGPRPERPNEAKLCEEVREIVSRVDWPCEVFTNFADTNLGCQERVISGLDWAFSLVEEVIILEDDCLPDPSFFLFCAELLDRYRGDSRVAYISGINLAEKHLHTSDSYYFSRLGGTWGWATWRSEWQRYDRHLSDWPRLRSEKMLSDIFDQPKTVAHWTRVFDAMHKNQGTHIWDYQWLYTCLKNNSVIAISSANLVINIGFGPDASLTTQVDSRFIVSSTAIAFPLKHPASFVPLRGMDRRLQALHTRPISRRIINKLRSFANVR